MPDVTKHYNLQKAGSGTVQNKWSLYDGDFDLVERGRTIQGTAGEALAAGDLVERRTTDGKFYKATNANRPLAGLAVAAAAINTTVFVQEEGPFTLGTWTWTVNQPIYAGATAGTLTQTKPASKPYVVALALLATEIWLFREGLHLATDVQKRVLVFPVPGDPAAAAPVTMRLIAPVAGTVKSVKHIARVAAATTYTYDLNKNAVTMYTTQANRPTRTSAQGITLVTATLPDVVSVAVDDILEFDLDIKGTGVADVVFFVEIQE